MTESAVQMYGVDWDTLAKEIPTKEKTQIKNYYQNYKLRLELDQIELPQNAKHPKASRGRGQGGGDSSRASTPRPGQLLPHINQYQMLIYTCICLCICYCYLRIGDELYYGGTCVSCIMYHGEKLLCITYYGKN